MCSGVAAEAESFRDDEPLAFQYPCGTVVLLGTDTDFVFPVCTAASNPCVAVTLYTFRFTVHFAAEQVNDTVEQNARNEVSGSVNGADACGECVGVDVSVCHVSFPPYY